MKSHFIYYDLKFSPMPVGQLSVLISIIFTLILFSQGDADNSDVEMAHSPKDLFHWVLSEILFVIELRKEKDISRLKGKYFYKELESYLTDFDDTVSDLRGYGGSPTKKATVICDNPIASHRVMRRIAYVLPHLRENIKTDADLVNYDSKFPSNYWVTEKDVNESMHGILRVHLVYDLDVELFADGIISGIHTGVKLLGVDCYEIGVYAHDQEFHTLSIQWLQLALSKSQVDKTVYTNLIDSAIQAAIHRHDEAFDNRRIRDPYFFTQKLITNSTTTNVSKPLNLTETQRKRLVRIFKGRKDIKFNKVNFWEMCTNGGYKSIEEESKLFCWLETKVHVYWLINPLKMEMLTRDPDVVQIYDVIRDEQISQIQEIATSTLKLSKVIYEDNSGESKLSEARTSMSSWIEESEYPETASLPLRIQQITGINVVEPSSSELLQLASYTLGGHFEVHQDALKTDHQYQGDNGDRIATFMTYLSDVELGGRTVFPQSGVAAIPVKGSALFWYDIHTDGEADDDTFHGACPVLLGKKWVANKWILYYDQFLLRKCTLKEKERFTVSVNNEEGIRF